MLFVIFEDIWITTFQRVLLVFWLPLLQSSANILLHAPVMKVQVDILLPQQLSLFHELLVLQHIFDVPLNFLCPANQFFLLLLCFSPEFELHSLGDLDNCFEAGKPGRPISAVCASLFARLGEVFVLLKAEGQVSGAGVLQSAGDEPVSTPGKRLKILAAAALVVTIGVVQPNILLLDPIKELLQILGISVCIGLFVLHRFIHCLPALWVACVHHAAQLC